MYVVFMIMQNFELEILSSISDHVFSLEKKCVCVSMFEQNRKKKLMYLCVNFYTLALKQKRS